MTVTTEYTEDRIALVLAGEIDVAESPRLRALLAQAVAAGERLVVDLSRASRIDSAIVANLVEALANARRAGIEFVLAPRLAPSVQAIFALSRLDRVFPIAAG